jgi:biotin operon repressor
MTAQLIRQSQYQQRPAPFTVVFWSERDVWAPQLARLRCSECGSKLIPEPPADGLPGRIVCLSAAHEVCEILERRRPVASFEGLEAPKRGRPPGVAVYEFSAEERRAMQQPGYQSKTDRALALLEHGEPISADDLCNELDVTRKGLTRYLNAVRRRGHDVRFASGFYVLKGGAS